MLWLLCSSVAHFAADSFMQRQANYDRQATAKLTRVLMLAQQLSSESTNDAGAVSSLVGECATAVRKHKLSLAGEMESVKKNKKVQQFLTQHLYSAVDVFLADIKSTASQLITGCIINHQGIPATLRGTSQTVIQTLKSHLAMERLVLSTNITSDYDTFALKLSLMTFKEKIDTMRPTRISPDTRAIIAAVAKDVRSGEVTKDYESLTKSILSLMKKANQLVLANEANDVFLLILKLEQQIRFEPHRTATRKKLRQWERGKLSDAQMLLFVEDLAGSNLIPHSWLVADDKNGDIQELLQEDEQMTVSDDGTQYLAADSTNFFGWLPGVCEGQQYLGIVASQLAISTCVAAQELQLRIVKALLFAQMVLLKGTKYKRDQLAIARAGFDKALSKYRMSVGSTIDQLQGNGIVVTLMRTNLQKQIRAFEKPIKAVWATYINSLESAGRQVTGIDSAHSLLTKLEWSTIQEIGYLKLMSNVSNKLLPDSGCLRSIVYEFMKTGCEENEPIGNSVQWWKADLELVAQCIQSKSMLTSLSRKSVNFSWALWGNITCAARDITDAKSAQLWASLRQKSKMETRGSLPCYSTGTKIQTFSSHFGCLFLLCVLFLWLGAHQVLLSKRKAKLRDL